VFQKKDETIQLLLPSGSPLQLNFKVIGPIKELIEGACGHSDYSRLIIKAG